MKGRQVKPSFQQKLTFQLFQYGLLIFFFGNLFTLELRFSGYRPYVLEGLMEMQLEAFFAAARLFTVWVDLQMVVRAKAN